MVFWWLSALICFKYLCLVGCNLMHIPFIISSSGYPCLFPLFCSTVIAFSLNEINPTELGLRSTRLIRIKMKIRNPICDQLGQFLAQSQKPQFLIFDFWKFTMNQEKSRNFRPPDPFFHGEIAIWKKGRLIQPPPPPY